MPNLLPLDLFREQLHYNPWHFWGFASAKAPVTSACNTVVKQYAWQTANAAGRFEIAQAIESAESKLRDYLNYAIAPHYANEIIDYPPCYDRQLWAQWPLDASGRWKPVHVREGYVQLCGMETLSLLETASLATDADGDPVFPFTGTLPDPPYLVYLDADGDGLAETFEVGIETTVTDPAQLAVYFAAADRLDYQAAGDRWRIQPVQIAIADGVATLRGRAWLLGKPVWYESYAATDLDPGAVASFVASLEIYQRTCDPTGTTIDTAQGKFIWDALPYPSWYLQYGSNSTDPASNAYAVARVGVTDGPNGIVVPGATLYDATTGQWYMTLPPWSAAGQYRPPDRVQIRYRAGYPLDADGLMAGKFRVVVARFAMAELDNRIAACDEAQRELYRWQRDRSNIADKTEMYRISDEDLNNPFGTRAGAIYAWKETKYLRLLRGVTNF